MERFFYLDDVDMGLVEVTAAVAVLGQVAARDRIAEAVAKVVSVTPLDAVDVPGPLTAPRAQVADMLP